LLGHSQRRCQCPRKCNRLRNSLRRKQLSLLQPPCVHERNFMGKRWWDTCLQNDWSARHCNNGPRSLPTHHVLDEVLCHWAAINLAELSAAPKPRQASSTFLQCVVEGTHFTKQTIDSPTNLVLRCMYGMFSHLLQSLPRSASKFRERVGYHDDRSLTCRRVHIAGHWTCKRRGDSAASLRGRFTPGRCGGSRHKSITLSKHHWNALLCMRACVVAYIRTCCSQEWHVACMHPTRSGKRGRSYQIDRFWKVRPITNRKHQ
jgi:hypothetical protein